MTARQVLGAALAALACVAGHGAASEPRVGLARVEADDRNGVVRSYVWYPSAGPAGAVALGPYSLEAAMNVPPSPGRYPVVLISHGSGGSALSHNDTAAALARHGFVVAAAMHPGDNWQDQRGVGGEPQLVGRARHLSALLDAVLRHPMLGPVSDGERVGVIGHSAGGYTALVAAGAVPDFVALREYYRLHPDDPTIRLAPAAAARVPVGAQAPRAEPRVRAVILWAPALGPAFDQSGLAAVRVPVRIYVPENDELLRAAVNAERIAALLPMPPAYVLLRGAGHFVFIAPCPPALRAQSPALCEDPPGVDRKALHTRLNAEAVDFFRRTLAARP